MKKLILILAIPAFAGLYNRIGESANGFFSMIKRNFSYVQSKQNLKAGEAGKCVFLVSEKNGGWIMLAYGIAGKNHSF